MRGIRSRITISPVLPAILIAICSLSVRVSGQCQYEVTAIIEGPECGIFGIPPVWPATVNDVGEVTGWYTYCLLGPDVPFRWTQESGLTTIVVSEESAQTHALDSNNAGTLVGFAAIPDNGLQNVGFIYDHGETTLLYDLPSGATSTELYAINNAGDIVGHFVADGTSHAMLLQDGVITDLHPNLDTTLSRAYGINDAGWVTGYRFIGESIDPIAYVWHDGEFTSLGVLGETGYASIGFGINNLGEIVGNANFKGLSEGTSMTRGFLWKDCVMEELPVLPGFVHSAANDINDEGVIVGRCLVSPNEAEAAIWVDGSVYLLEDLVRTEIENLQQIDVALSISNPGVIAAQATIGTTVVGMVLTPIGDSIGDLTGDCIVNFSDLLLLLSMWGDSASMADLDGSGAVGFGDLLVLLAQWD